MSSFSSTPIDRSKYLDTDQLQTGLKFRALRGAGATLLSQALSFCIHFVGTISLARLLTPADFGLVTISSTFCLLLQNFGFNGLTEVIIQRKDIRQEHVSALFWINLASSLMLTLLFMGFGSTIAELYGEPRLKMVILVMAFSIFTSGFSTVHSALLKRSMQFYVTSGCSLAAQTVSITFAIIAAWKGFGYWALVVGAMTTPVVNSILTMIACRWRPGIPALDAEVKQMLRFALNTYGNFAMNYFSRNADNGLIGWWFGPQTLGYYKKAYDFLALPVAQLSVPLANVALATLSRLNEDHEKFRRYYLDSLSLFALIGMLLSTVLFLTGKELLVLLLGSQWEIAGEIFVLFSPAIGIMLLYSTHGWLHLSLGTPNRWFRWGAVEFVVIASCVIIALPFGAKWVALGTTISFYILLVPALLYGGKPVDIKFFHIISAIWQYFLAGIVSAFLIWSLFHNFGFAVYMASSWNAITGILMTAIITTIIYGILVTAFCGSPRAILRFFQVLREVVSVMAVRKSRVA